MSSSRSSVEPSPLADSAKAPRARGGFAELVGRPAFWAVAVALIAGLAILRALTLPLPAAIPVLGTVPPFELVDQHGQRFGSEELRGRAWVADFVFTRCGSVCPILTQKMIGVQDRTKEITSAFHLVSITVDPENDTPAVLLAYVSARPISRTGWSFLTGPPDAVRSLIRDGFKEPVGTRSDPSDVQGLLHDPHAVLVDAQLRIRGYYDLTDDDAVKRLVRDAGLVANGIR